MTSYRLTSFSSEWSAAGSCEGRNDPQAPHKISNHYIIAATVSFSKTALIYGAEYFDSRLPYFRNLGISEAPQHKYSSRVQKYDEGCVEGRTTHLSQDSNWLHARQPSITSTQGPDTVSSPTGWHSLWGHIHLPKQRITDSATLITSIIYAMFLAKLSAGFTLTGIKRSPTLWFLKTNISTRRL